MPEIENKKKEQWAIIIGFFLILLVILITLFRSDLLSGSNQNENGTLINNKNSAANYPIISVQDLQKKILLTKQRDKLTLLDIRPFKTYSAEHIVDAVNVTPEEFPLDAKIDAHNLIIIIGENDDDGDISKTVTELKKEKFDNFLVLSGGMATWTNAMGATVTYGDPNSFTDQAKVSYVESEKLNEAFKQNIPMYIVDIRTADEYAEGHLQGSVNIPFEEIEKRRSDISENRVVLVGINELQEFQAAVQMYDMLLVSPFVLKGAIPEWQKKGFSLVK
jgi:rhodanese-related sulfurtransferase